MEWEGKAARLSPWSVQGVLRKHNLPGELADSTWPAQAWGVVSKQQNVSD